MRSESTLTVPSEPVELARLPVPDLRGTLDKYLSSLEPFLLDDEARGGMPFQSSYALRAKWADDFESGIGRICQDRLLELDKMSPHNWLDDNFWMNKAYLERRVPLLINSNWWIAFNDDDNIPANSVKNAQEITPWQVRRSTWLAWRLLDAKRQLDSQEFRSEPSRTGLWLRESTSRMFNIGRVPQPLCDIISEPPHIDDPSARQLLVMVHDWCYAIEVYRPTCPPNLIDVQEMETRLRSVVYDAKRRLESGEKAVPIGALSADGRDKWSENLQHLLSISPANQKTHETILHSLFAVSLEDMTHALPSLSAAHSSAHSAVAIASTSPFQQDLDSQLHMMRATNHNVSNRMFDKPMTLIVDPSGRAGGSGEHSPCDALVPSIAVERALADGIDASCFDSVEPEPFPSWSSHQPEMHMVGWERLEWEVDDKIRSECEAARKRAKLIIDDSDNTVFWFEHYGTAWIKNVVKHSPDAYIQMALQLAYYKASGEFTATYETALTRMFKRGRTETIRAFTKESRAWVLAMLDGQASSETKLTLLQHALNTQSTLTREAAVGRGIDRHLLGLRLMLRSLDGEQAMLFDDELFERSQRWKLCTSSLSAGHMFRGTGFGAAYEDGYGINYLAAPNMIKFGIESKFSSPQTSTDNLKNAISNALSEMAKLCAAVDVAAALCSPLTMGTLPSRCSNQV